MLATDHSTNGGHAPSRRALWLTALSAVLAFCLLAGSAFATLPDKRGYELVSPLETNGGGIGNAIISTDGEKVDLQSEPFGDATIGGQNLYQSVRSASGWTTKVVTPKSAVEEHLFAQTAALFFSPDLTKSIFTTAQPLDSEDQDEESLDLYEVTTPGGAIDWVSQGPESAEGPPAGHLDSPVTFDSATRDGNSVVFSSFESLTKDAQGINGSIYGQNEYLYDRDLSTGQTTLVDVDNEGKLLNPEGAILGNGVYLSTGTPPVLQFLPSDMEGTTTNAISDDGRKIFFESPNPGVGEYKLGLSLKATHLYMRENGERTAQMDAGGVNEEGESRYLGASQDGSKVFFVSNSGLGGDEFTDTELYMYDTLAGTVTPISVVAQGSTPAAASVYGVSAISNDGSHVYYVARGVLANNVNGQGLSAVEGEPNFYVYDVSAHTNTFVTKLGQLEVETPEGGIGQLVSYLDLERPAVPTPDGNVLAFSSKQNLTGEDPSETAQVYRYEASTEDLVCVSCDATGAGYATMAISREGGSTIAGGTYDPPGHSAPMDEKGDEIVFNTSNGLVSEDRNTDAPPGVSIFVGGIPLEAPRNIDPYEWHDGHRYLLSSGEPGFSGIQGITPSGDDILIDTNLNLTKQDTGGYAAVYDVRVNGGFPEVEAFPKPPCTTDESCHGAIAPNPLFAPPGSMTLLAGPEAVPPPEVGAAPKAAKKKKKKKKKKRKAKAKRSAKHARKHSSRRRSGSR